jgi:alkanesulfonate monooxygenase SsuD/methylene tetrahydromethanopterin reductase-like flavin-dependent oxidoreductase (luciferase family)
VRIGIALADGDLGDDGGVAVAEMADAGGIDSIWVNETGQADALVTLGAWSQRTERVTLATGVIPFSPRSSAHLELAAAQVGRLAPGRFVLGVGVGQRSMAEHVHQRTWRSPLDWTADELGVLRGHGFPVVVGALGPKMLDLAARQGDGALLNWTTPAHARLLREQFDASASDAGREPGDLLLTGYVRVAVGDGAANALATQIDLYSGLPFYREHWESMGNPANDEVALTSEDGTDLPERLAAWDALDAVVARIVPSASHDPRRTVEALCTALG